MAKKRTKDRAPVVQVWVPHDLRGDSVKDANGRVTWPNSKVKGNRGQPVGKVEVPLGPNPTKADRADKLAQIHRRFESIRAGLPLPDADLDRVAEEEHRRAFDLLSARYLEFHGKLGELETEIGLQGIASDLPNPVLNGVSTDAYAESKLKRLGREPTRESVIKLGDAILRAQSAAVEMIKHGRTPPPLPGKPVIRSAARGTAPRVNELVEKYLASRKKVKEKTRNQARTSIQLFTDFADDPRVDTIDRATVAAWASDRDSKGDAAATVNKHISMVGKFWQWCQDEGHHIEEGRPSPFLRHRREIDRESTTYLEFTPDELQKLVRPSNIRWHIIVALFSGLRDSEFGNAKLVKHGGGYYFDVAGRKRGKTPAAKRKVPVARTLIKLGIIEAWPRLTKLSASVVSKRFTRWRIKCGIADHINPETGRSLKVFHSLRKNFNESMVNAHVSSNTRAQLLGHSRGFTDDVYNPSGEEFKNLVAAVAKVKYKGFEALAHFRRL